MSNRIYDASHLTKRKYEKTVAGSFLTRINPPIIQDPQQGFAPLVGIYDSSILNSVKTGQITEYNRYPSCVLTNKGCCPPSYQAPIAPGPIQGMSFGIGSIIVSWNQPLVGTAPFTYRITPYLNGVAQNAVTTSNTSYRFTDLDEWKPYTFTICAINSAGSGPTVASSSYIISPPNTFSAILSDNSGSLPIEPSLKYIINISLDKLFEYVASNGLGPTRGSRFMYLWIHTIVGAWKWVHSTDTNIIGIHDNWNWSDNDNVTLSPTNSILWICLVIDYIMPHFINSGHTTLCNCPRNIIEGIKTDAKWDIWVSNWNNWFNLRKDNGHINASIEQPIESSNWNNTIVVDDKTITDFTKFGNVMEWTRLTINNKKQTYLTYNWNAVNSSCLSNSDESYVLDSVSPLNGTERDDEIDYVKTLTSSLTDEQKVMAEFWAGGGDTVSPPLMMIWFWKEYMRLLPQITCSTVIYSLLDLAIHLFEGGRITWGLKAKFMESRPIQEIRRRYAGQQITSWNGTIDGSQWVPYQESNFVTPPFADFPSGHSHFSKAFALTMNKWFGESIPRELAVIYDGGILICPLFKNKNATTFGKFLIEQNTSLIQANVPSTPITLSFNKWDDIADQAGISRLYGGIHALNAHTSSQTVASLLHDKIESTWAIHV